MLGHHYHILDPYPAFPRDINARFNRDDHSRSEGFTQPSGNARSLVDFQAHAMAGGMGKILA
jgi:hypothetical protein